MTSYASLQEQLVEAAKQMASKGLVIGSEGNVSVRIPEEDRFLITPSSLPYAELAAGDTVLMDLEGEVLSENRPPSMEAVIHRKVYIARPGVGAVFHTHSRYASALSAVRMRIPAFLEELVPYLGGPVEVAEYAPTASDELADNVCRALGDRAAVLVASHGTLCVGSDLGTGLNVAELVEEVAQIYILARSVGTPFELPEESLEMHRMFYKFTKTKA
jgi:L-fuculose-phosphate aldolase